MKIAYRYSDDDFFALCEAKAGYGWRRTVREGLFWLLVAVNLGFGGYFLVTTAFRDWTVAGNLVVALGLLAFRYIVTPWSRRRALNQQMIHGRDVVIETDEGGISGTLGPTSARAEWSGVHRADETATHFIVWTSKATGFSIPKTAFGSDERVAAFRNDLDTRLRASKPPAPQN